MIRFLISKPVSVIMTFIAFLLTGMFISTRIPISPLPNLNIPEIIVHVSHSNASGEELELSTIKVLRTQLGQVPNLNAISSEARDGYGMVKLRFDYGTDINYAFIEVNENIDLAMSHFPSGVDRPRVVKTSATDIPIFHLNVSLVGENTYGESRTDFSELSDFTVKVVKRRLEQLPEIAFADVSGFSDPTITISPKPGILSTLSLSDKDFKAIIEANTRIDGDIWATDGLLQYKMRFKDTTLRSALQIQDYTFNHDNRILRIGDIADVKLEPSDRRGSFIANNKAAISLAIIKQPDVKLDDLQQKLAEVIGDLKKDYPNINFEQSQDQTQLLEYAITSLKQDLVLSSVMAFLLMFFFLRNLRSPLLIGIAIPVCLILSIFFFQLLGVTINIISLSGLILGVGLMIDNSIIVIDNITQWQDKGSTLIDACVNGTTEIIRPLLASMMTTCCVFLPLVFLSGIAGALFYDQAIAITIGLSVSFIVSITLLPTLYYLVHKKNTVKFENRLFSHFETYFFERIYERGFKWVFNNKMFTAIIVLVLVISNIFVFINIRKERLPEFRQTELIALIDWNRNITIDENETRVKKLVKIVEHEIIQSNALIGEQQYLLKWENELSPSQTQIYLKFDDNSSFARLKKKISNYLSESYPEASFDLNPPKNVFERIFGSDEAMVVFKVAPLIDGRGVPKLKIDSITNMLRAKFPNDFLMSPPSQQIMTVKADFQRMTLYKVNINAVYEVLKNNLNSVNLGVFQQGQSGIPVILTNTKASLQKLLPTLTVMNDDDAAVPLRELLTFELKDEYRTVYGDKKGNFVPLELDAENPGNIVSFADNVRNAISDVQIDLDGSYFSTKVLIEEMILVLIVAIILLYFILAAQFESLIQPLIVLLELPISMSGALILLYFCNSSINLISLIGLVVMCGIIINDSILKIDMINQLRRNQDYPLMQAIHVGGKRRLKAILMTALTTILSVSPFLFGDDMGSVLQRSLSLALIGGMLIGTPVSLYFIPLVYWFYYRKS